METRLRRFVFTLHNYDTENWTKQTLIQTITTKWKIDYMIIGQEITQDNQIPHYQGYIEFTNPTTIRQVILRFSTITQLKPHIEDAKGDAQSNYRYCSKSNDFAQYGNINTTKLKTDDIATNVMRLMVQGLNPINIGHDYPEYSLFIIKNFKNLMDIYSARALSNSYNSHDPYNEQEEDGDLPF